MSTLLRPAYIFCVLFIFWHFEDAHARYNLKANKLKRINSRVLLNYQKDPLTSSTVFSFNIGNLLLFCLLKLITLGVMYFAATSLSFSDFDHFDHVPYHSSHWSPITHELRNGPYYSDRRMSRSQDAPISISSQDLLWGFLFTKVDDSRSYSCLLKLACIDQTSAEEYVRSGKVAFKFYKVLSRFLPFEYNPKYKELISGLSEAVKVKNEGKDNCKKRYKCKLPIT